MVANRNQVSDGLYMTEAQYLALDDATDGKYEASERHGYDAAPAFQPGRC